MAVKLLQVLVLGVIAAAAVDDVPITWVSSPRATLPCHIPDATRVQLRRPPPPLEGEPPRVKPYLWRRNGEIFRNTSGNLDVHRKKDPEAVYQCMVRHQGGGLVLGYPVNLRYAYLAKEFSTVPKEEATAWLGQPFVVRCDVGSGPPANITWIKNDQPLRDDTRYQHVNNQLIITEVKYEDVGTYRCRVHNILANRSRISPEMYALELSTEEPPANLEISFLQVQHDTNIEVARGSRVVLPCYVIGSPKPQLIWEMTPPGENRRTGELESTEELLVMPNIELDQVGVYVCRVVGHNHLVKRFTVTIATAVNMTHAPESRSAARAATVRFNCTASGSPPLRTYWYKNGLPLQVEGRYEIVPSVIDKSLMQLLIRSVTSEDAGVYQCFVYNSMSVASAWAHLNVSGGEVAAAPSDVRCWPSSVRDLVLRWQPIDNKTVVAYIVQFTGPDGSSLPSQPVSVTETLITVKSPLTPYSFQVRAFLGDNNTATHMSNISKSVVCQGQGVPIKLFKAGEDSILVSWREYYIGHRGVQQWILQHKAENSSNENNITLDANIYNYTLKVSPREPQQVRVLGTKFLPWLVQNLTLVPWTASSVAGHYLPPGGARAVPEDVEVTVVNARNFTMRWRFKEEPSKTYSFMVCTRKVGGNDDCIESLKKSAVVSKLQPNSEYEVRVQARLPGQILGGDFSSPIPVTTSSEGYEHFRNLTYKFINGTTINVSWKSDSKNYYVRHNYNYTLPMSQWTKVDVTGNTVNLTGLDPTKELIVIVQGYEPFSLSPVLTIPVQIPGNTHPSNTTSQFYNRDIFFWIP